MLGVRLDMVAESGLKSQKQIVRGPGSSDRSGFCGKVKKRLVYSVRMRTSPTVAARWDGKA